MALLAFLIFQVVSVTGSTSRISSGGIPTHLNGSLGLLDLQRCAKAKADDSSILTIVSIISSAATDFNVRHELRGAALSYVQSTFHGRKSFRSVIQPRGIRGKAEHDIRPVCVQSLFLISPWREKCRHFNAGKPGTYRCMLSPADFHKIVSEAETYQDVLIAPTIPGNSTGNNPSAPEFMHLLRWSRSKVPWADYVMISDTATRITWNKMIELFPPPPGHKKKSLWYLGMGSEPNRNKLFFHDTRHDEWKPCAAGVLHGFSRDLVKRIANAPIASQLYVSFKFPLHVQLREQFQPGTWVVSNVSSASLNYWNMTTISDSRGCSDNHEGIAPIHSETLKLKQSSASALLAACKMWCSSEEHCVAIDYYRKTRLCKLYSRACAKPLATHDGASSYKIAQANKYVPLKESSSAGMMGFLGDSRKYVCNAIQTVLRYLPAKAPSSFRTTLVPHTAQHRFWHRVGPSSDRMDRTGQHSVEHAPPESSNEKQSHKHLPPLPKQSHKHLPHFARLGRRCAQAKLADPSLLAFVGLVATSPFDFAWRKLMRRTLSLQAQQVTNRTQFRKIVTRKKGKLRLEKVKWNLFKNLGNWSQLHGPMALPRPWRRTVVGQPVPDKRAVCIDVIFVVGLTRKPWDASEQWNWHELVSEAQKYNDIEIGPYLDGRGKGLAMTMKTVGLLLWASQSLSWADHVFKIDTDTFVNWKRMVQVFPAPNNVPSFIGTLHGPYTSQGSGPACANGELYGLSGGLLQTIGRLIDNAAYIAFYLKYPAHTIWKIKPEKYPYMLVAPEDLVTCSFLWQATLSLDRATGTTTRFDDFVLEKPEYWPLWAHDLKKEKKYLDCASLVRCKCRGQYGNRMPTFELVRAKNYQGYCKGYNITDQTTTPSELS